MDGLVYSDGIYVIPLDGDLMVERMRWDRANRRIALHSRYTSHPEPRHVPMDGDLLRTEGKVVGWFHRDPHWHQTPRCWPSAKRAR